MERVPLVGVYRCCDRLRASGIMVAFAYVDRDSTLVDHWDGDSDRDADGESSRWIRRDAAVVGSGGLAWDLFSRLACDGCARERFVHDVYRLVDSIVCVWSLVGVFAGDSRVHDVGHVHTSDHGRRCLRCSNWFRTIVASVRHVSASKYFWRLVGVGDLGVFAHRASGVAIRDCVRLWRDVDSHVFSIRLARDLSRVCDLDAEI